MATRAANIDIDAALAEAIERYRADNPKSLARHVEACAALPGGNTRTVIHVDPFPLAIRHGEGARLTDLDGHEYIDFLSEFTAGIYGHSHPLIRAAIEEALRQGLNFGAHNAIEARFAAAICARFPSLELVRFTNSGTEANLMALSAARAITGRPKILVFDGGYHGGVFYFRDGGSPINAPFDYLVGRYNDIAAVRALVAPHRDALAAILVEPMLGSGGCIPADLTTLGKYVGGGMSFGAFGGRADLMAHFDPRRPDAFPHAGTFNNNVLTMSAGLAGLTRVYTPERARSLNALGERLRERLNESVRRRGLAMQFTGLGSMMAVHMTKAPIRTPADAARGSAKLRDLFYFDMVARGIWIAKRGMIALSIALDDEDCDRLVAAVEEFAETRAPLFAALS